MTDTNSKICSIALTVLALTGFGIFIGYFVTAFPNGGGHQYEFASPLPAMWTGLGMLWYTLSFLFWWGLSRNLPARDPNTRDGLWALYAWTAFSLLFAIEGGFACFGWALAKNESATAGLSFLWVITGVVAATMSIRLVRVKRRSNTSKTEPEEKQEGEEVDEENAFSDELKSRADESSSDEKIEVKSRRCRWLACCCTKRFWIDLFFLLGTAFLMIFTTSFFMQGAASARDAKMEPLGELYNVAVKSNGNTFDFQMHLHCFGEKATPDSPTVITEHGGGANSVTMLALAQELQSNYNTRACIYDRLGYGFTPSYYTSVGPESSSTRVPNSGVILSKLLDVAGEAGPFVCAGHSAGGEACLWFAHEQKGAVTGVAILDGYPDLIRAGSFRPGVDPEGNGLLSTIQGFAIMAGGTGLTRGLVGNMGPDFVPADHRDTVISLYGQSRFWFAQYWDVRSSLEAEEESQLYQKLGGTVGKHGLVTYGGTLSGTKVLVLPAESTVSDIDCEGKDKGSFCCGHAKGSNQCNDQALDREIYRNQTELYATTLSNDTLGLVIEAPEGSEHGFVNHKDHYQWTATQIGEQLLK